MGTVANEAMRTYGITNGKDLVEMYPIGSIYISVDTTSPAALFGGTWEQLEEGQFLMNTYLSDKLDADIAAGLPDIRGKFSAYELAAFYNSSYYAEGSLYVTGEAKFGGSDGHDDTSPVIGFKASAGQVYNDNGTEHYTTETGYTDKTVYGKSNTVQPRSLGVHIWKRVAPTG